MTATTHDDIDWNMNGVAAEQDSWTPISLTSLPDTPPIEPTLGGLGVGLIYPGKRHVFSGPPESAKTLAAYAILINVVRGGDTAVLIDFEMGGYDARARLRELSATDQEIERIHYLEPDEPATTQRLAHLVDLEPQLVVFDSALGAYHLQGFDDSSRGDVEKLNTIYIAPFWKAGIATILIDHVVKDSEQRGRYAIGSERKLGGADVSLGFETISPVSRGTSGRYKIVTNKDRGAYLKRGHVADLEIESDPETHRITARFTAPAVTEKTEAGFKYDVKMEQISTKLQALSDPISGRDLFSIVAGNKQAFHSALADLISAGYARRISGPQSPIQFVTGYHREQVVPGGTKVVPEQGTGELVPGTPPYGEVPVPEPYKESPRLSGWYHDDGAFIASELAYLESIAPDEETA